MSTEQANIKKTSRCLEILKIVNHLENNNNNDDDDNVQPLRMTSDHYELLKLIIQTQDEHSLCCICQNK